MSPHFPAAPIWLNWNRLCDRIRFVARKMTNPYAKARANIEAELSVFRESAMPIGYTIAHAARTAASALDRHFWHRRRRHISALVLVSC